MSILSELREIKTGGAFPGDEGTPIALIHEESKPTGIPAGFGEVMERRIYCEIGFTYRCNDAEHSEAKQVAMKQLHYHIYRDVLKAALDIESAVYGRDWRGAMAAISRLRDVCE